MGRHSIPDPDDAQDRPEPYESEGDARGPEADADRRAPEADADDEVDAGGWRTDRSYDAFHELGSPDESPEAEPETGEQPADESPTRAFAATPPPGQARSGGRNWDGEWTGSHRAIQPKRRGVSVGVIVALVSVVVIVAGVILWRFLGDALSNRSQVSAARCVEGEVAVAVLTDASITDQVNALADQFNQQAAPVGDKCVKVGVRSADPSQVVDGFTGTWPGDLGDKPALWIPASSMSEARLDAAAGRPTISDSRSLVTSPVVLAVRPQLEAALGQRTWTDLPRLQSDPAGLDGVNLPGWGGLRLALPRSGDADATDLLAEAVATAAAPQGAPATAGVSAVRTLLAGAPRLPDDTLSTAFDALLSGSDAAAAPVHAVATTEQQLFQKGASLDGAKEKVAGWSPSGSAAIADYPTVLLTGDWLSQEQVSAASEFARFLRKPEALGEFAKAGFRVQGTDPPASDVTDFGPLATPVTVGDAATRATLAEAVGSPAANPAVTIMLDQSMNTDEGGQTRLANVTAALQQRLAGLAPTAAVGLWTFDGVSGRSEIPLGPLADPVNGQPRSTVLADNLRGQVASGGGAVSFTTLRLLYTDATANYREGQPNSVLVVTAGPHTDQSLDGPGLEQFVRQTFQQAKPIAVNVVDFGGDPDRGTWEAVSQITGGTYANVASSTGPELAAAIATALG